MIPISPKRVRKILETARQRRVLVVGDVMLDQFLWGKVARISPEAPVPIVEFERESFMPGGAANVAHNLTTLETQTDIFGAIGADTAGKQLRTMLEQQRVGCAGLVT